MEKIIAIPISISVLLVFASYFVVNSSHHNFLKFLVILLFSWVGFGIWDAMPSYFGYATVQLLPDEFVVVWANVSKENNRIEILTEPYNPIDKKEGILDYRVGFIEKRFYRMSYNEGLGKTLEEQSEKIQRGIKVVLKKVKGSKKGGGQNGQGGREGGKGGYGSGHLGEYIVHDSLPPGRMPPKD